MALITIVTGAYKPTNITGGGHIVHFHTVEPATPNHCLQNFLIGSIRVHCKSRVNAAKLLPIHIHKLGISFHICGELLFFGTRVL